MMLTGKCKEKFKEWISGLDFEPNENEIIINTAFEGDIGIYASDYFNILLPSMKYGVLVDFFDSVGFKIFIEPCTGEEYYVYILPSNCVGNYKVDNNRFTTRLKAQEQAIEQANELFNNKHK